MAVGLRRTLSEETHVVREQQAAAQRDREAWQREKEANDARYHEMEERLGKAYEEQNRALLLAWSYYMHSAARTAQPNVPLPIPRPPDAGAPLQPAVLALFPPPQPQPQPEVAVPALALFPQPPPPPLPPPPYPMVGAEEMVDVDIDVESGDIYQGGEEEEEDDDGELDDGEGRGAPQRRLEATLVSATLVTIGGAPTVATTPTCAWYAALVRLDAEENNGGVRQRLAQEKWPCQGAFLVRTAPNGSGASCVVCDEHACRGRPNGTRSPNCKLFVRTTPSRIDSRRHQCNMCSRADPVRTSRPPPDATLRKRRRSDQSM